MKMTEPTAHTPSEPKLSFVKRLENLWHHDDVKFAKARAVELSDEVNRAFTEHPESAGESYWQHWWFTFCMGLRLIYTGVSLLIHGLFPFFFVRTASNNIAYMYGVMRKRVQAPPPNPEDASGCDI